MIWKMGAVGLNSPLPTRPSVAARSKRKPSTCMSLAQ